MNATCSKCGALIYLAYKCGNTTCLVGCPRRWLHVEPGAYGHYAAP